MLLVFWRTSHQAVVPSLIQLTWNERWRAGEARPRPANHAVLCAGLGGRGHHAGRVQQRPAGLQRQTEDQQVLLAKDPEDLLQKEQLLH